ncbi:two-component sensor histidine kinase [Lentzea sp. NBRC 105346]|uniref:sensor histidine kinase n=1 Tax=Lentzea sp. NBRC 105346 TaxID=3032205 RepID=UPI0024A23EAA|nr:histidine kinase [Lentzea sp. NBRC 105346]GLZ28795.1 two-component sensor histidine kinase [Lentzea sp. NBRC 105346]
MSTATYAQYGEDRTDTGGRALTTKAARELPSGRTEAPAGRRWSLTGRFLQVKRRDLLIDVAAIAGATLDVWLGAFREYLVPLEGYSYWLTGVAAGAMLLRRKFPFLTLLLTIPGFIAGWAQMAAMIALGTVAWRNQLGWKTLVGTILVWVGRFISWPPSFFFDQKWQAMVHDAIWAVVVVGLPLTIAFLARARQDLADRIAELAASRERERVLHAHAVRADERARLAREMHDVVSHQVSLIAMQAGALRMAVADAEHKQVAGTIRTLSTRTLDELRQLVSVLRTTNGDEARQPGVDQLPELVADAGIEASLSIEGPTLELPPPISGAIYRTVQEALTNIRKHAPGAHAEVLVVADEHEVRAEVRNTHTDACDAQLPSGGHGLIGLKERAKLLDGEFDAGPTEDGGFRVTATFPITRKLTD